MSCEIEASSLSYVNDLVGTSYAQQAKVVRRPRLHGPQTAAAVQPPLHLGVGLGLTPAHRQMANGIGVIPGAGGRDHLLLALVV